MQADSVNAIHIHAVTREILEERLEAAVKELQAVATTTGSCGILVTRLGPNTYTAELSEKVPFGITQELAP
ncbi:hypothetical protein QF038_002378 [Pseudarthrobacter sp. W1I19]|uniref:hypothetical protein n=1 Tax=Pseudarthrobacter sp. W1I19 TaxID=3042288 RepID=UPI002788F779|nr:hypothetical protein [Pseudarthrobacter sp. W1I19]MDQ0923870.1 hypothetical protein [Pseudarthrobacter sp. W1I19]